MIVNEEINAMNSFTIVDRPKIISKRENGKYDALLKAMENLSRDKSICLARQGLCKEGQHAFKQWSTYLQTKARKQGLKIRAIELHNQVYIVHK